MEELVRDIENVCVNTEAELQEHVYRVRRRISESDLSAEAKTELRQKVQSMIQSTVLRIRTDTEKDRREKKRTTKRNTDKEQIKTDLLETSKLIAEQRTKASGNLERLMDSDRKIGKIKGKHAALENEINSTRALIRKRKEKEAREIFVLFVAVCLFSAVCTYILLSRTRALKLLAVLIKIPFFAFNVFAHNRGEERSAGAQSNKRELL